MVQILMKLPVKSKKKFEKKNMPLTIIKESPNQHMNNGGLRRSFRLLKFSVADIEGENKLDSILIQIVSLYDSTTLYNSYRHEEKLAQVLVIRYIILSKF